jgi:hypothetical protein
MIYNRKALEPGVFANKRKDTIATGYVPTETPRTVVHADACR